MHAKNWLGEEYDDEYLNFRANISDFKCEYDKLKTKITIINPYAKMVIKPGDRVLIIGDLPIKKLESFFLKNKGDNE